MPYTVQAPHRLEAELLLRKMSAGRNGAVLVLARGEDGSAVEVVTKLAKAMAPEQRALLPIAYLCEWLAAEIGRVLGVRVPPSYELVVTSDYADALADAEQQAIARGSLGSAFACEHVWKGVTQYTHELPDPCLRNPAAELLAFDVLIHNPDRRKTNPNLLVGRGEVIAFDHGDAFSFLLPVLFAPDPALDALDRIVDQHACREWLRHRQFSLDRFREALAALTDEVLGQIATATPSAWQSGTAAGKLGYILDVMKRRRDAAPEWLAKVEAWLNK